MITCLHSITINKNTCRGGFWFWVVGWMEMGESAVERWVVRASLETLANELSLLGFWQKRRKNTTPTT
jgi:hypothetical protein